MSTAHIASAATPLSCPLHILHPAQGQVGTDKSVLPITPSALNLMKAGPAFLPIDDAVSAFKPDEPRAPLSAHCLHCLCVLPAEAETVFLCAYYRLRQSLLYLACCFAVNWLILPLPGYRQSQSPSMSLLHVEVEPFSLFIPDAAYGRFADEGRAFSERHEGARAEEDCDALCPDAHEGDPPARP